MRFVLLITVFCLIAYYELCTHAMRLESVSLDYLDHDYADAYYELKRPTRTTVVANANCTLHRKINNIDMTVVVLLYQNNKYVPTPVNFTTDMCDYFKRPTAHPMTKFAYTELQKYGNLPTSCPIKPNFYQVYNVSIPRVKYVLDGRYRVICTFSSDGKLIAKFTTVLHQEPIIGPRRKSLH